MADLEIERKWLLAELPADVDAGDYILQNRYFLLNEDGIELRIQQKGEGFELERKVQSSELSRTQEIIKITEAEFNILKKLASKSIERKSYRIGAISIKEYLEDFSGLIRAEVEFENEQEAELFVPPAWFGREITDSPLGKDKKLITLTEEAFQKILAN